MRKSSVLAALVFSLLFGFSPLAADPLIHRGIDIFITPNNGTTFYDFAQSPIPAGFFCKGSKAFTGRVAFKGLPLATGAPGQLRDADTVIERLDDAVFDEKGIAATRIQFRALSLVSSAPIKTACGAFHVYVSLSGQQQVTTMNIYRTQDGGGNFVAPLALNARLTFISVKPARDKAPRKLALTTDFTFPASPLPWRFTDGARAKKIGPVMVDTNGDLAPDMTLPGTSNFLPGASPESFMSKGTNCCPELVCHSYDPSGKQHCYQYLPPECATIPCTLTMD